MSKVLGRGLGSLIPKKTLNYGQNPFQDSKNDESELVLSDNDRILQVNPNKIDINPQQPRTYFNEQALQDLADSIKEHGIISPLIVSKKGDRLELIAGERRLRSAKLISLSKVPVIIRAEKEQKKLELALIENLQRENLNPLEYAQAYKRLMSEFNLTQEEVAHKLSKARSSVANSLRLLNLAPEIQRALADGRISEAHAKYILSLNSEDKQLSMFKKIVRQNLTVAETDRAIKSISPKDKQSEKNYKDRQIEKELSLIFSTKVELKKRGQGGKIVIHFFSSEELNDIIEKMK